MILLRAERTVTSAFLGIFALVAGGDLIGWWRQRGLGDRRDLHCTHSAMLIGKVANNAYNCLGKVALIAFRGYA